MRLVTDGTAISEVVTDELASYSVEFAVNPPPNFPTGYTVEGTAPDRILTDSQGNALAHEQTDPEAPSSGDALAEVMTGAGDMIYKGGGENIAASDGTASGSAAYPDSASPAGMIDGLEGDHGYPNGYRMSNPAAGQWGKIDLGDAYAIESARLLMGTAGDRVVNHYDLQYSRNNSTWTTVDSLDGTPVERDHTFVFDAPITARFWRVLLGVCAGFGADIVEFQLFTAAAPARLPTYAFGRSLLNAPDAAAARALLELP